MNNIENEYLSLVLFQYDKSWSLVWKHLFSVWIEAFILIFVAEFLRMSFVYARDLLSKLEDKVAERTRALEEKAMELTISMDRMEKLQKTIIQREKLASLGTLTAGIAHEIKNPLNIMLSASGVLKSFSLNYPEISKLKDLREDSDEWAYLLEDYKDSLNAIRCIDDNIKGLNNIVSVMLNQVSTSSKEDVEKINITSLVTETLKLSFANAKREFNAPIVIDSPYDEDQKVFVKGSAKDLQRAFVNIFDNAFYTVSKKHLKNEKKESYIPKVKIDLILNLKGKVVVEVSDNGQGILDVELERVFEPFFTTKPTDEGTGLGLSTSRDIITSFGGDILVDSEYGRWTTLKILFPMTN